MNKKICFVSTISGTMKSFILPIAYQLTKEGMDITLICSKDDSMVNICLDAGVHYHPIQMGRGIDISGVNATREIERFLKSENFDMVQYCTPNAACYTSIAAKKANVPIRLYCQWGIRYVGLSGLKRTLFKMIEKKICDYSTNICAVSWKNRDFAVAEGLYEAEKACVVGNGGTIGVDMTKFDIKRKSTFNIDIRKKYNIPLDFFVFGFCGRLTRDKGINELLSAYKKISEYNQKVVLFIIGEMDSNKGVDKSLLKWAEKSNSVIFTGNVPGSIIHQYYAPMDVLVHPTYREGFGMVIQEAGAFSIPCITTEIPGASEVMIDEQSCLLIRPQNDEELYNAMIRVLNDGKLVKYLGENAFERTFAKYNRPIMLKHQKSFYIELLSKM